MLKGLGGRAEIDISHFDHYTVAIELSATACLLTLE
jgi:hypothetical protein